MNTNYCIAAVLVAAEDSKYEQLLFRTYHFYSKYTKSRVNNILSFSKKLIYLFLLTLAKK